MSVPAKFVLENTKGKVFEVDGIYYGHGAFVPKNPRPEKYPFPSLYTDPDEFYEPDPKRLFWFDGEHVLELSPFRIKSVLVNLKNPKKSKK
jgi:hypothetical protein